MQFLPADFTAIKFLDIKIDESSSKSEVEELNKLLTQRISEYVLLKLTNNLTEEQLQNFLNVQDNKKLESLDSLIPDLDQKIKIELGNFEREFNNG